MSERQLPLASHSFSKFDSSARPRPVFLVPHASCEAYPGEMYFRLRPVRHLRIEIYRDLDSSVNVSWGPFADHETLKLVST